MNEFRGRKPTHSDDVQTAGIRREPDDATVILRQRHGRWGIIAGIALVAVVMTWAAGRVASRRVEKEGLETASRYHPPSPGYPKPNRPADNNNTNSRMGYVANLDGTVVAYAKEVNGLVSKGQFRIDLPLVPMAEILCVSPTSIASPRSPDEIDPDAELFKAQAGTLSENGKECCANSECNSCANESRRTPHSARW